MKRVKNILLIFKTKKLTTFFVMFGFVISMLMISFNISFICALKEEERMIEKLSPPSSYIFSFIEREKANDFSVKSIADNLEHSVDEYTGAYLGDLMIKLDKAKTNEYFEASADWFGEKNSWSYPILEGRCYTSYEIKEEKKVALIGKDLKKYMDNDRTISIHKEKYNVVGIVGLKEKPLPWDSMIFMPMTSLPSSGIEIGIGQGYKGQFPMVMYNCQGNTLKQIDNFIAEGKNKWDKFDNSKPEVLHGYRLLDDIVSLDSNFKFIAIMLYIAAIIQSIVTMMFWIQSMKFEVGLRKAMGHTNFQISRLIYGEIFVLTLFSFAVSIFIQSIFNLFMTNISGYDISLKFQNLVLGIAVVVITSLIVSVYPILKSFKVQPTEAMKL
ncbi:ABC transporter permease [Anaerosalibacter bizertensis]|uniref:ABC transporter permease n=1 Tax=Anaerosalibacter bizertensis TaxID=932217 RepID=A0A844FKJ0_9FIRM|nr:ABC transporter permease [Anaerosalibacter bizertensis]MBU5294206.1 ABC transporter permease [Anaerosalibacter bizertensis]MSS44461.1 ABC transporter permease [Anaerosalibacter bizertensis]